MNRPVLIKLELSTDAKFQQLLKSPQQPYANTSDLPQNTNVGDLLCAVAFGDVQTRWNLTCARDAQKPDLKGKIVVLGTERSADNS